MSWQPLWLLVQCLPLSYHPKLACATWSVKYAVFCLFSFFLTPFQIAKSPFKLVTIYYDTLSSFVCLSWLYILIFGAKCDFSDLTTCLYIGGLPGLLNDEIIAQTGVSCKSLIPQRSTWWNGFQDHAHRYWSLLSFVRIASESSFSLMQ